MNGGRLFFALALNVAIAAACSGSTSKTDGGADGSSSDAGDGGSGDVTTNTDSGAVVVTAVPCGGANQYCNVGEYCCTTTTTPEGGGGRMMTSIGCVATMADCSGGTVTQCTSAATCASGQVCCREPVGDGGANAGSPFGGLGGGAANTLCESACPASSTQICMSSGECPDGGACGGGFGGGFPFPGIGGGGAMTCQGPSCSGPSSCGRGEVCCTAGGAAAFFGGGPGAASCQTATSAAGCSTGSVVCTKDADCPSGQICATGGGGLPFAFPGLGGGTGMMTCQGPPCTAPSGGTPCSSGQVCCGSPFSGLPGLPGGGGGGPPMGNCQTPTSGGCPAGGGGPFGGMFGGMGVLCNTPSDCPSGQTCNAGMSFPGFTGGMTCSGGPRDAGGGGGGGAGG